jgi:hypothetical protein
MNHQHIFNLFSVDEWRVESMIYLAGSLACYSVPGELENFFSNADPDDIKKIFPDVPDAVAEVGSSVETFAEWLRDTGKLGFLVQYATPVMTKTSKDSADFSWGHYYTQWIYMDKISGIIPNGYKWRKECRRKDGVPRL